MDTENLAAGHLRLQHLLLCLSLGRSGTVGETARHVLGLRSRRADGIAAK